MSFNVLEIEKEQLVKNLFNSKTFWIYTEISSNRSQLLWNIWNL